MDSIKLMLSPGIATEGADVSTEQFALDEVQAAVYEAHKVGRSVLSHAIGIGGIRNGVEAGVDSIDHGHYLDEEQAHKMKAKGIYLVPTFGPTHYYVHKRQAEPWRIARAEQVEPIHAAAFKLALDIGVPIALGCDCGAQSRMPNGENALEIELMVQSGMQPMAAILAATREAAHLARILRRKPGRSSRARPPICWWWTGVRWMTSVGCERASRWSCRLGRCAATTSGWQQDERRRTWHKLVRGHDERNPVRGLSSGGCAPTKWRSSRRFGSGHSRSTADAFGGCDALA